MPTGELIAVKEVPMTVEGAHMKEAVEQLEQEVSSLQQCHGLTGAQSLNLC